MYMKLFRLTFLIVLLPLNLACNSSDDDSPQLTKDGIFPISELSGNWDATKAQFSVSTLSVDVVEGGGTAQMSIQTNGKFSLRISPNGRTPYTISGEMYWEKWQQTYHFTIVWDNDSEDWINYSHTYDGTTFTFNGGTDSGEYDFNNDGEMQSCSIHFILVRT